MVLRNLQLIQKMRHTLYWAQNQTNTPKAKVLQNYSCPKTGYKPRKIGTFSLFSVKMLGSIRFFQQLVYKRVRSFGEWWISEDKRFKLKTKSEKFKT